jgi:hypothetical protein
MRILWKCDRGGEAPDQSHKKEIGDGEKTEPNACCRTAFVLLRTSSLERGAMSEASIGSLYLSIRPAKEPHSAGAS